MAKPKRPVPRSARSALAASRGQHVQTPCAAGGLQEPQASSSSTWPLRRGAAKTGASPRATPGVVPSSRRRRSSGGPSVGIPAKSKLMLRLGIRLRVPCRDAGQAGGGATHERQRETAAGARSTASAAQTRACKRRRPQQGQARIADMVGTVTESKEDHLKRHGGIGMLQCPRCRWYRFGPGWVVNHGCLAQQGSGPRQKVVWLSERPERWHGPWGLGCAICSDLLFRHRQESPGGRPKRPCLDAGPAPVPDGRGKRLGTAWARYEVRPSTLQASHVSQHERYDVHKIAVEAFLRPDVPVRIALQATQEDDRLLCGAVPQPADWLRAWRAVRSPKSWQAAAAEAETEHFIHHIRHRAVTPRSIQALVEIMREVVRQQKRQWIRDCSSIFIGVDDRQSRKLVRFKCDMPALAATQGQSPQWAREGILGCIESVHGKSFTDFNDDYARGVAADISRMVSDFATPLGGAEDVALTSHFKSAVRGFVADKALQKVGHFLKTDAMKNIVVLCRDPCHMIRIACKDPLNTTGDFQKQHERLFGKHGLFKDPPHFVQRCQCHVIATCRGLARGVCQVLAMPLPF